MIGGDKWKVMELDDGVPTANQADLPDSDGGDTPFRAGDRSHASPVTTITDSQ